MENPETQLETEEPRSVPPTPSEPAPPVAAKPPPQELPQKSPILAAFLSFIPGLGNVYNGLYRRAVTFFLIYASLFALTINGEQDELPFLIPCVVFFFFFNVFDAYRQATLINYGVTSLGEEKIGMYGWGLTPGVFLLVLGAYGLFRRYFNIDLSWVMDQWPFALIAFGGWMIYQYFQEQKEA